MSRDNKFGAAYKITMKVEEGLDANVCSKMVEEIVNYFLRDKVDDYNMVRLHLFHKIKIYSNANNYFKVSSYRARRISRSCC